MSWWQLLVHRFAATRPGVWLMSHSLHHLDRVVIRRSSGRHSLTSILAGQPVVTLTTTGARSGLTRSVPLVGVEDGERVALIASNYGRKRHPAWYHNLRANPEAELTIRGRTKTYIARQADGEEREEYWLEAVALFAGYAAYEKRAGGREIPIVVLTPVDRDREPPAVQR